MMTSSPPAPHGANDQLSPVPASRPDTYAELFEDDLDSVAVALDSQRSASLASWSAECSGGTPTPSRQDQLAL